jgi:RHS repeat-associated protein
MIVQKVNRKIDNYKHGPLARSVIGQQQVQGIEGLDYAYTLEGWLKGINSISLQPANDMGNDGLTGSLNQNVARDAYGFNLNYFTGEYSAINSGVLPFPGHSGYMSSTDYKPLYNGNISSMAVNIGKLNEPLLNNYQYDQLNRIVSMDAFNGLNQTGNDWTGLTKINDYQERASYDANGNIQTYLRNGTTAGGTPLSMDNLTYNYSKDANGNLTSNKLTNVYDAVPAGNYPNDIDDQSANNYSYDAIGNLIQDNAGGINTISWTVYGKISNIAKADGSTIAYTYDASGNRISKTVTPASGNAITTWYIRDAGGNVMAVYTATGSDSLHQSEQHLYGSSRLGIFNRNINADASLPAGTNANLIGKYFTSDFTRGNKIFELSNHLGNVLVTVSDKKIGHDAGNGTVDYYTADVVTANDYYPFGSLMPGRTYSIANTNYRYGFNGKENDNDVKGEGNQQDYGMRIYDTRLGRFLSVDKYSAQYPYYSPYQFSGNSPIAAIDINGLEPTGYAHVSSNSRSFSYHVMTYKKAAMYAIEGRGNVSGLLYQVKDASNQDFWVLKSSTPETYYDAIFASTRVAVKTEYFYFTKPPSANEDSYNGGKWLSYLAEDEIARRQTTSIANGMEMGAFGMAAIGAALPVVAEIAPTLINFGHQYVLQSTTAAATERFFGAGLNATYQYIENAPDRGWGLNNLSHINLTEVGLSALNPSSTFVNSAASNFGKFTIKGEFSEAVGGSNFNLKKAIVTTAVQTSGGKIGERLGILSKYGGFSSEQGKKIGDIIGETISKPGEIISEEAMKKDEKKQ